MLAQGCSALWVLKFLTGRRALLRLRWNTLRLQAARVRRILALGTSGFVMSMTNSLVQVLCNASLQHYGGDLYVGVMTVINSIREVVSMPVQGITNGCQPVLGYNYGAGEYERVRRGSGSPRCLRWATPWRRGRWLWPCPSCSSVSLTTSRS